MKFNKSFSFYPPPPFLIKKFFKILLVLMLVVQQTMKGQNAVVKELKLHLKVHHIFTIIIQRTLFFQVRKLTQER